MTPTHNEEVGDGLCVRAKVVGPQTPTHTPSLRVLLDTLGFSHFCHSHSLLPPTTSRPHSLPVFPRYPTSRLSPLPHFPSPVTPPPVSPLPRLPSPTTQLLSPPYPSSRPPYPTSRLPYSVTRPPPPVHPCPVPTLHYPTSRSPLYRPRLPQPRLAPPYPVVITSVTVYIRDLFSSISYTPRPLTSPANSSVTLLGNTLRNTLLPSVLDFNVPHSHHP